MRLINQLNTNNKIFIVAASVTVIAALFIIFRFLI